MTIAFRYVAIFLIVVALMLLGADLITSLQDKALTVRSLGQIWGLIAPGSLGDAEHWAATLPRPLPDVVMAGLSLWAWGVSGLSGVLIAFLLGRNQNA